MSEQVITLLAVIRNQLGRDIADFESGNLIIRRNGDDVTYDYQKRAEAWLERIVSAIGQQQ